MRVGANALIFCAFGVSCLSAASPVATVSAQTPRSGVARALSPSLAPSEIVSQILKRGMTRRRDERWGDTPDALDNYVASVWRDLRLPDPWNGRCATCEEPVFEVASTLTTFRLHVTGDDYRFLVFNSPRGGEAWRLLGDADTSVHYDIPPADRVETTRRGPYLVLEHDTGGTGMYGRGDTWFDLAGERSAPVLDLPTEGHDEFLMQRSPSFCIVAHEWKSRIEHRPDDRDPSLRASLSVRYTLWDDAGSKELFAKTQTAAFVWDERGGRFRLDPAHSNLREEEFRAVYKVEGMDARSFAKFNAAEVGRISAQGTEREKRAFAALGVKP